MKNILILLFLLTSACGADQYQKRNAELVVTYEGKEVHRASSVYSSQADLERSLNSKERKYIIFSAEWCPPCKTLLKALEQSGHIGRVMVLNLDEPWVAYLYQAAGLKIVPSMLVADSEGAPENIISGTPQIVMHLLINVEVDE